MARSADQYVRELIGSLGVENSMLKAQLESAREELAVLRAAIRPDRLQKLLGRPAGQSIPVQQGQSVTRLAPRPTRMNGNPNPSGA